jgi:hypothetical protein
MSSLTCFFCLLVVLALGLVPRLALAPNGLPAVRLEQADARHGLVLLLAEERLQS